MGKVGFSLESFIVEVFHTFVEYPVVERRVEMQSVCTEIEFHVLCKR